MKRLTDESEKVVSEVIRKKRAKEAQIDAQLDMGFYFSVVFATRKDRDDWLCQHGIKLHDDEYVFHHELTPLLRR